MHFILAFQLTNSFYLICLLRDTLNWEPATNNLDCLTIVCTHSCYSQPQQCSISDIWVIYQFKKPQVSRYYRTNFMRICTFLFMLYSQSSNSCSAEFQLF